MKGSFEMDIFWPQTSSEKSIRFVGKFQFSGYVFKKSLYAELLRTNYVNQVMTETRNDYIQNFENKIQIFKT